MFDDEAVKRYEKWFASEPGRVAFARERELIRRLVSAWPRRKSTLLEVGCGTGIFLETFYDAGFDVTGVDPSPAMLKIARRRMGQKAFLQLGHAERLCFDDKEFDYVALLNVLEFCDDPVSAVAEAARTARKGILVGWLNRRSLYYLLDKKNAREGMLRDAKWFSAREVKALLQEAVGPKPIVGWSVLPGPMSTWQEKGLWKALNRPTLPLNWGAFCVLRVDLVGEAPLTPLFAMDTEPETS